MGIRQRRRRAAKRQKNRVSTINTNQVCVDINPPKKPKKNSWWINPNNMKWYFWYTSPINKISQWVRK